jgi:hypothetical protein
LFLDKSDNSLAKQENHAIESTAKVAIDVTPSPSLEKPPHTPIQTETDSFEQFLASMPTHDQEKYIKLNEYFFGVLAFNSPQECAILKEQGFPSIEDINYVTGHSRKELSLMLWNNTSTYPQYTENPSLNLPAINAINLLFTIKELEETINYYLPEYTYSTPIPNKSKWPGHEIPNQVQVKMANLVTAFTVSTENTGLEILARARSEQLVSDSATQKKQILKILAMANKKLQGNDNILNYVKKHYPKELDTYIDLTNNL